MPITDQVTQPQKRSRATPRQILKAFLNRIKQLPEYREGAAVICDQTVPPVMPLGRFAVTVSMSGGNFNRSLFASASHQQLSVKTAVNIGIFVANLRERVGMQNSPILDEKGIVDRFEELLAHLFVADPRKAELSQQWEPVVETGELKGAPLLRSLPVPESFSEPREVQEFPGWMGMTLVIGIEFDWNVYA